MALYAVLGGVDIVSLRRLRRKTLTIEEQVNGRTVCTFQVKDLSTAWRPSPFDQVSIAHLDKTNQVRTTNGDTEILRLGVSGSPWVAEDVGKLMAIAGAGPAGSTLITTVQTFNSASSVDVFPAPSTTVINVPALWGARLFAGTVSATDEGSIVGTKGLSVKVSCVDFNELPERRTSTKFYAEPILLKDLLTELVTNVLSTVGLVLHPDQPTGPVITQGLFFTDTAGNKMLDTLSDVTGYQWRVDFDKRLIMVPTTVSPAANNLSSTNSTIRVGARVKQNRKDYRNWQTMLIGSGQQVVSESFAGNGTRFYPLNYNVATRPAEVIENGVPFACGQWLVDAPGSYGWFYDNSGFNNRLVQDVSRPLLGGAATVSVSYNAQFPLAVDATNPTEMTLRGTYQKFDKAPEIFDRATGLALAQGMLRKKGFVPKTVTLETGLAGFRAGMTTTITFPERNLSGTHLITAVRRIDQGSKGEGAWWNYELDCVSGTEYPGFWLDYYKELSQGGASGSSVSGGTVTGGGSSGGTVNVTGAVELHLHMGGMQGQGVIWDGTGTGWIDIAEFVDYSLFKERVPGSIFLRVHLRTSNAGCSVTPRFYNVSTGAGAGDGLPTVFTGTGPNFIDFEYQGFGGLLSAGEQVYRVQVKPSQPNVVVWCARATLENRL